MICARWMSALCLALLLSGCESAPETQSPADRDDEAPGVPSDPGGETPQTPDPEPDPDPELPPEPACGDGHLDLSSGEGCDDGNLDGGDGCSATCQIEPGWSCPTPGWKCRAARCGDGIVAGAEACDPPDGVACDATCKTMPGYVCPPGEACRPSVCGDGVPEGDEACDDGNLAWGDGCTPDCRIEPVCGTPGVGLGAACTTPCGSGLKLESDTAKACDDGNLTDGDGCSATCQIEPGWTCALPATDPARLELPIVYRDFIGLGRALNGGPAHVDFENANASVQGLVDDFLDGDGKPVRNAASTSNLIQSQASFASWYRDDPALNRTLLGSLTLDRTGEGTYAYENKDFFPLDGKGWVGEQKEVETGGHNFSFTSELRHWFTFQGGERLDFYGDDDVWVFVNNKLAVDIGGVHGPTPGSISLDASNAGAFGLEAGKIYEIVVFQAERHTTGSQYKLTLKGFNAGRSACTPVCGDGVITSAELCDDGEGLNGAYGHCGADCQSYSPFCGDAAVQAEHGEKCDDGPLNGTYGRCAADCSGPGPRCGDGITQEAQGEQCDEGGANGQSGCSLECTLLMN